MSSMSNSSFSKSILRFKCLSLELNAGVGDVVDGCWVWRVCNSSFVLSMQELMAARRKVITVDICRHMSSHCDVEFILLRTNLKLSVTYCHHGDAGCA